MTTTAQYDLMSPQTRANPQAVYNVMRDNDPVYLIKEAFHPLPQYDSWFITRYDDAITVLKEKRMGREFRKLATAEEAAKYPIGPTDHWMLHRDPPDHTRLRALVHKAFTPKMVADLRPRIAQIAGELLAELPEHGEIDLMTDFAIPLPVIVIAELLGIPVRDRQKFRDWSQVFVGAQDESLYMQTIMEFINYMNDQIDQRKTHPQDDLITALSQAEDAGDSLSHEETLSMIQLLLIAGHETTVNLIGNGTLALLQHPDQLAYLREHLDDADAVKLAVEEMLRFNGPVDIVFQRYTFEDVDIGGKALSRGDMALVSLLAANRDPAVFDNPNTFDLTREKNPHIAFGNGIHYCVGAPLARLEAQIAFPLLLKKMPNLALNAEAETLQWTESVIIHGLKALPVRY